MQLGPRQKRRRASSTLSRESKAKPWKGLNTLVLVGVNWGGPANLQGSLTIGAVTQKIAFQASSNPNGIAWTQNFVIPA
jgi:hypothetical protein